MNTPKSYDEAIAAVEQIVNSLEKADALSVQEYRERAAEAKRLLDFCEGELKEMTAAFATV